MKKRIDLSFILKAAFLSVLLAATVIGCSGGVDPNPNPEPNPGTTENDVDFKVVETGLGSATVSWNKTDIKDLSFWIVTPNEVSTSYEYEKYWAYKVDKQFTAIVSGLKIGEENTIYLCGYKYVSSSNYELLYKEELKVEPKSKGPVTNLTAYYSDSFIQIMINWDKIPDEAEISKIVISRKAQNDSDFVVITELGKESENFIDSNFEFEKKYLYRVETFDLEGESCGITETSEPVETPEIQLPKKVIGITKDETYADGILIKWAAQGGVDKYIVEVAPCSDSNNITKIETTEPSCFYRADIEKGAGTWLADIYVKVTAVNSLGDGPVSDRKNLYVGKKTLSCSAVASNITDKTATVTVSTPLLFKEATVEYALLNSTTKTDIYMDYQESGVFELTELIPETKKTVYPAMKINYKLMDGTEKSITTVGTSLSFTTDAIEGFPKTVTGLNTVCYADGVELTWDAQEAATKYVVGEFKNSSDTEPEKTYEVTENSFFREKSPSESFGSYFRVYAENELGKSKYCDYKSVSITSTYSISNNSTEIGKTTAKTTVTLKLSSGEVKVKKAKIEYAIGKTSSDTNLYCDYQESNVFELTGLNFAENNVVYAFVKITYTLNDEEKVYKVSSTSFSITTESFDAPATPVVESVTRGSATVSFTPFTEEQLYGVDSADVVYEIKAYEAGKSYADASVKTEPGVVTPVTVTGLKPATSYQFAIRAVKDGSINYGKESEKCVAVPTKAAISKPVIKTIEEVSVDEVPAPFSVIGVTFDPVEEDTDEEIMYGLEWEIFEGSANAGNYAFSVKDALSEVTDLAVMVNGGNRYFVTLYAYSKEEGLASKVRSEPKAIQLKKVDDTKMLLGLYYTEAAGALYEGQILDITNSKTWNGSFTPKSTTSVYNWGLMSNKGNYVVKFGLNSDMMAKTSDSVYLYYVQQYSLFGNSKIGDTTLSQKTTTYFIAPDTDCTPLVTFADYSSKSPSSNDPWNMPEYSSSGNLAYSTFDKPTRKGVSMTNLEQYMFNNGLYLGIYNPSTTGASVGVSYRY